MLPSRALARDLGILLHTPAAMALGPLLVCVADGEWFALPGFALMMLAALGAGQLLFRWGSARADAPPPTPMVTAALAWLLVPLLGAVPFYAAAHLGEGLSPSTLAYAVPLNAFFESMSGFTSTGLTVAPRASELPQALQLWRSLMEWTGAIGIVVLALVLAHPAEEPYALYAAEGRSRLLAPDLTTTARRIWKIYLLYTAAAIAGFMLAGMPAWEALNHGLTGIGTGGFSVRDDSFERYRPAIKVVAIVVIILGSISFQAHSVVLYRHRWRQVLRQPQLRLLAAWLAAGAMLLGGIRHAEGMGGEALDTVFTWVSALGTCGLASVQVSQWGAAALLVVTAGMVVGGMAGSTAGGLKMNRLLGLARDALARVRHPGGGAARDSRDLRQAAALAVLWMISLLAGTLLLLLFSGADRGLSFALFEAASALNGVGLSVGIAGPDLHWGGRLTLIVLMWIGRLEIVTALALIAALFGTLPAPRSAEGAEVGR